MARSLDLDPGRMSQIAQQVADFVPGIEGELTESFDLFTLGATDIPLRSMNAAESAEQVHHQIRSAGVAIGYARSTPISMEPEVIAVRVSDPADTNASLAAEIDEAIRLIDEADLAGEPLVRLLVVPAHAVHALWITSDHTDRLVVVDCPEGSGLVNRAMYDAADFLETLAADPVQVDEPAAWQTSP